MALLVSTGAGFAMRWEDQVVHWHEQGWGFAMRQGGCNGDVVLRVRESLEPGNGL